MNRTFNCWKVAVILIVLLIPLSLSGQTTKELRVITYNLRSGRGYGELDNKTALQRFCLIGQEVKKYQPDILIVQEPGGRAESYDSLVAAMGTLYQAIPIRCPNYEEPKRVGLLIVSNRVQVDSTDFCISSGSSRVDDLFNHWGRIVLSFQDVQLVVYGFKLAPRDNYAVRQQQIDALAPYMRSDVTQKRLVIVAGDLNHRPFDVEYPRWMKLGLVDSYDSLKYGSGFTKMDELGADRLQPYRRIDYILTSKSLAAFLENSSRTLSKGLFVPEPPRRRWSLSDHLPVMATFKFDK
ncbi:MAG: endonuclease/exonuclease/phosphatase family protein [Bacteroidota bacterium]